MNDHTLGQGLRNTDKYQTGIPTVRAAYTSGMAGSGCAGLAGWVSS